MAQITLVPAEVKTYSDPYFTIRDYSGYCFRDWGMELAKHVVQSNEHYAYTTFFEGFFKTPLMSEAITNDVLTPFIEGCKGYVLEDGRRPSLDDLKWVLDLYRNVLSRYYITQGAVGFKDIVKGLCDLSELIHKSQLEVSATSNYSYRIQHSLSTALGGFVQVDAVNSYGPDHSDRAEYVVDSYKKYNLKDPFKKALVKRNSFTYAQRVFNHGMKTFLNMDLFKGITYKFANHNGGDHE